MTLEKAQKDFMELIAKNGFTEAAKTTDTQNTVYHREWAREVEVAWHGKQQDTLEIRMMLCGTAVLAAVSCVILCMIRLEFPVPALHSSS